jgi:hypothetical protein
MKFVFGSVILAILTLTIALFIFYKIDETNTITLDYDGKVLPLSNRHEIALIRRYDYNLLTYRISLIDQVNMQEYINEALSMRDKLLKNRKYNETPLKLIKKSVDFNSALWRFESLYTPDGSGVISENNGIYTIIYE